MSSEAQRYPLSPGGRRTALILLIGVVAVAVFAVWTLATQAQGGLSGPEWITAALMVGIILVAPVVAWNLLEERAAHVTTDATGLTYRSLGGIALHYTWSEIAGVDEPPAPNRWARLFLDDPSPSPLDPSPAAGPLAAPDLQATNHNASPLDNDNSPRPPARAVLPAEAEDMDQAAWDEAGRTIPLRVVPPPAARLASPLLRALWQQAHGATLPLPAGLEGRAALLATIRAHGASPELSPPA